MDAPIFEGDTLQCSDVSVNVQLLNKIRGLERLAWPLDVTLDRRTLALTCPCKDTEWMTLLLVLDWVEHNVRLRGLVLGMACPCKGTNLASEVLGLCPL
jgi:hypothetical protein